MQGYNSSNSDGDSDDDEPNSKRSRKSGGAHTSQHQPDSRATPHLHPSPSVPKNADHTLSLGFRSLVICAPVLTCLTLG